MAIPIFWRLILGTMGILLLSVAAGLYSIIQLGALSRTARAALDGDQRMIDYQEALTDSFLSEVRYGGKYIFTHTEDRHDQLRQFKNDFARYLGELRSLTEPGEIAVSLSRIEQFHRRYHELFDREVGYIRTTQTYAQSRYQQERDKILESALGELGRLKTLLQTNLQNKLQGIDRGARTARQIGILTTVVVLLLGAVFSLKFSRSIVTPLKQLELNTAADHSKPGDRPWIAIEQKEPNLTGSGSAKAMLRRLTMLVGNALTTCSRWRWQKTSRPGKANNR